MMKKKIFVQKSRSSIFSNHGSTVAGGVAKSEQGATADEIEVGSTSSDGDWPPTVLKLVPEIANT